MVGSFEWYRKFASVFLFLLTFTMLMPLKKGAAEDRKPLWDMERLSKVPATYPVPGQKSGDVEGLFYEGLPYKGKPTRVFAYLGIPPRKNNEKLPAVVLVHGGGGTAYAAWVRLWNSRGYAAIAMDLYGGLPELAAADTKPLPSINNVKKHEFAGPSTFAFDNGEPPEDQWIYHAVADVILANSLLRSRPEIDPERIGLTGISWGGIFSCIVAGLDQRFKLAAPVYGCGFLTEKDTALGKSFAVAGPEKTKAWADLWDPAQYIGRATMPFLWTNGTNDLNFPLPQWQKSYRLLPASQRTLAAIVRMPHDHPPGFYSAEVYAFIESQLNGKDKLAVVKNQAREANEVTVQYESARPIVKAELNYTSDAGSWEDRLWKILPASVDAGKKRVRAQLPEGVTTYYINLVDARDLIVSTEHVEVK